MERLHCTLTPVEGCRRCKVAPHIIVKTWPRLLVAGVPGEAHQASVPLSTFIPQSHPHLLTPVPAHPLNKLPARRPRRPLHISPPPSSHPGSSTLQYVGHMTITICKEFCVSLPCFLISLNDTVTNVERVDCIPQRFHLETAVVA